MKSDHARAVSAGMKNYWARPGVRERRKAAVKYRDMRRRLESRIRGLERNGRTDDPRYELYREELVELERDHIDALLDE